MDNRKLRKQLAWPATGLAIGAIGGTNSVYQPHIPLGIGVAVWFAALFLVLVLSGHPVGARVGVLLAGFSLAVPCFLWESPLLRGMLMCFMAVPVLAASAFVLAPPIPGFRERLAYLLSWFGNGQVKRRAHSLDLAALLRLIVATAVFAAAIAVAKVIPASGSWRIARWLAAGIFIFATAEMASASVPLVTTALGVTVPPWFRSPYLSASIGEFWSKRWNLAGALVFRKRFFAPLAAHSVWLALSAAFAASAVGHVLVAYLTLGRWRISFICGAFFLVQPLLIAAERGMNVRRWLPLAARAWTLTALAITSPLFVEPLLQIIEQSWGTRDNVLPPTLAVLTFVISFSGFLALAALASQPSVKKEPLPDTAT